MGPEAPPWSLEKSPPVPSLRETGNEGENKNPQREIKIVPNQDLTWSLVPELYSRLAVQHISRISWLLILPAGCAKILLSSSF